jgi:hypothetical protein
MSKVLLTSTQSTVIFELSVYHRAIILRVSASVSYCGLTANCMHWLKNSSRTSSIATSLWRLESAASESHDVEMCHWC